MARRAVDQERGGHAVASGQRLCRPGGPGAGTACDGREVEREDRLPELLATLALEGGIVTIDAMGTQPNMAQAIRDRGAD